MPRPSNTPAFSNPVAIGTIFFVIAILYFAKEVLVPFTLAILLSFLLAPVVTRIEGWKVGRVVAVIIATLSAFAMLLLVGWIVAGQMLDLANRLPSYRSNITHKIESLHGPVGGILSRTIEAVQEMGAELRGTKKAVSPADASPSQNPGPTVPIKEPVPVEIIAPTASGPELLVSIGGPLLKPLGIAGIVIILAFFILLDREHMRDRLISLVGHGQLYLTTQAIDEAGSRVSRYMLMQLIVNVSYGVPVAIGLYVIGIPHAILWGLLATLLHYIPYVGSMAAASMPVALSIACFDSWSPVLLTVGLFTALDVVVSQLVEPLIYRSQTGISTVALLMAAAFWTWLWGPVGLILSTPLTVCLGVIGRHVPCLNFLNTLLSDQPGLTPAERFCQRLLAMDLTHATQLAEDTLKESGSLERLYDELIIPALILAEHDRRRTTLDEAHMRFIYASIRELIEDLDESEAVVGAPPDLQVLCLPGRDEADELVSLMLAQLLRGRGVGVELLNHKTLAGEMPDEGGWKNVKVICVSVLPPVTLVRARYLCKRLRRRFPKLAIIAGVWSPQDDPKKLKEDLGTIGADGIVNTLTQAVESIAAKILPVKEAEAATGLSEAEEPIVAELPTAT